MHPSSYEKMAGFCRDYLANRADSPLVIVDLGSWDYNGSYRPLFDRPPWRYVGVDLTAGQNVDIVLRDPYNWRELKSNSVDVLVSGQTFEHTEFFWETVLEIARVLKPGGLCCIIAPATGPEHRFPLDCWRIFADGMRSLARYAHLEVLYARTQWEELPQFDSESNKWHESILIARKPAQSAGDRWRQTIYRALKRFFYPPPRKVESLIQVFYTGTGAHSEEASIIAGVEQGSWRNVAITLPEGAAAALLRIDFMRVFHRVDIAELRVSTPVREYFSARTAAEFDLVRVDGDARRLPHADFFQLQITGADPQLFLPKLEIASGEHPVVVRLRVRIHFSSEPD
jgi:SAM-dependent methyltransferase